MTQAQQWHLNDTTLAGAQHEGAEDETQGAEDKSSQDSPPVALHAVAFLEQHLGGDVIRRSDGGECLHSHCTGRHLADSVPFLNAFYGLVLDLTQFWSLSVTRFPRA